MSLLGCKPGIANGLAGDLKLTRQGDAGLATNREGKCPPRTLLGENELSLPRDAEVVLLLLMDDDQLAAAGEKDVGVYTRQLTGRACGRRRSPTDLRLRPGIAAVHLVEPPHSKRRR
jgi:hypothetical protein